jgi:hypothetical protein
MVDLFGLVILSFSFLLLPKRNKKKNPEIDYIPFLPTAGRFGLVP